MVGGGAGDGELVQFDGGGDCLGAHFDKLVVVVVDKNCEVVGVGLEIGDVSQDCLGLT